MKTERKKVSRSPQMTAIYHGWALINKRGRIVTWRSMGDDPEEGIEIHRTRRLAKGAAFKDEYVVPIDIIPRRKATSNQPSANHKKEAR